MTIRPATTFTVSCKPPLLRELKAAAARRHLSRSEYVRMAVSKELLEDRRRLGLPPIKEKDDL